MSTPQYLNTELHEAEAHARLEWDAAKRCIRMVRRESLQLNPQDWLIGDLRRNARHHTSKWINFRREVAHIRRQMARADVREAA